MPYILQLRNFVFGRVKPGLAIRLGFYPMFFVGLLFFVWNVLSSIALQMRYIVWENKSISIKDFLSERAVELEIHPDYILAKLLTFFAISSICWIVFLLGMILFWRKKRSFFWVSLSSLIFYIGMALFYVGGLFFWEEFTGVDKIALFSLICAVVVYRFLFFAGPVSRET